MSNLESVNKGNLSDQVVSASSEKTKKVRKPRVKKEVVESANKVNSSEQVPAEASEKPKKVRKPRVKKEAVESEQNNGKKNKKPLRVYKCMHNDVFYKECTGTAPMQAGRKALKSIIKADKNYVDGQNIHYTIVESSEGKNDTIHKYYGNRTLKQNPVVVHLNKDVEGKDPKNVITYKYDYNVYKIKKSGDDNPANVAKQGN